MFAVTGLIDSKTKQRFQLRPVIHKQVHLTFSAIVPDKDVEELTALISTIIEQGNYKQVYSSLKGEVTKTTAIKRTVDVFNESKEEEDIDVF